MTGLIPWWREMTETSDGYGPLRRFAISYPHGREAGRWPIQRRGSRAAYERGDAAGAQYAAAAAPYDSSKTKESWRGSSGCEASRRCGRLERDFLVSPTSLLIGQPLAIRAFDGFGRALSVVNPKRDPLVVAEVELAEIPLQVLCRNMVIGADHATFEDREIAFDRVSVPEIAPNIFLNRVVDRAVPGKVISDRRINRAVIGHHIGRLAYLGFEDRLERRAVDARHMPRAHPSVTLYQGHNGFLRRNVVFAVSCFTADVGFVNLDNLVRASKLTTNLCVRAHSLADAMAHEPRRFVGDVQRAMQLVRRDAFLTGAHKPKRKRPLAKRHVAPLHDRAYRDRKGFVTGITVQQPGAVRLPIEAIDAFCLAAMWAVRAIRPADRLEMLPRFRFVSEDRIGEVHGVSSLSAVHSTDSAYLCQRDNLRLLR